MKGLLFWFDKFLRDAGMQRDVLVVGGILCILMIVFVSPASAFSDTFQNGYQETWYQGGGGQSLIAYPYPDTFVYSMAGYTYGYPTPLTTQTNYASYTVTYFQGVASYAMFVDANGNGIGTALQLDAAQLGRIKIVRTNGVMYLYQNGNYVSQAACAAQPYGIKLSSSPHNWYFDDFLSAGSGTDIVGGPPHTWYLAKDFSNPTVYGLFNAAGSNVYSTYFHVSYGSDTPNQTIYVDGCAPVAAPGYSGIATINITPLLATNNYGIKTIRYGNATDTINYLGTIGTSTYINWGQAQYGVGDTAIANYGIASTYWIPTSYTYSVQVARGAYDAYGNWTITPVTNVTVGGQAGSISYNVPSTGTYYALLYANQISNGAQILLGYSSMTAIQGVIVNGVKYDAGTGLPLSGVAVNVYANGVWYNTTTNAQGQYSISGMPTGSTAQIYETKAGYTATNYPETWTMDGAGTYNLSYGMTNNTQAHTGTAINGLVYDNVYCTVLPGATVNIWNATWSSSTTSSASGYFEFDNLYNNTYYQVNASKSNYVQLSTFYPVTTGAANSLTTQNIPLSPRYSLVVNVFDANTNALILSPATVTLNTGQIQTTSSGTTTFSNLTYGYYSLTAACQGYYASSSQSISLTTNPTTQNVYLYPSTTASSSQNISGIGGPGSMYPPHQVRFFMLDNYGRPLSYLNVTATPIESTAPWGWLTSWVGINSTVNVQGTTLTGTTGLDGSWDTMMVENVRYNVTVVNLSQGVNYQFSLYPLDDTYRIFLQVFNKKNASYYPNATLWAQPYNATWISLNMSYYDPNGRTPLLVFYVMNATYSVLYNNTWNSPAAGYTNWSYQVPNNKGDMYFWGINATNTDFGIINRAQGITMKGTGPLVDFGIADNTWYIWFALLLMFLVAGIFSAKHIPLGVIVTPLWGGALFWYIGWLPAIAGAGVTVAGAIGVLVYMRKKEYQLRV